MTPASDDHGVPSSLSTALVIAALTWKRLLRGRALWVSGLIALLPVMFAAIMRSQGAGTAGAIEDLLAFQLLLLAVLPPMFVAASVGEEIEDRTMTYLWSRPVQRWTVIAGKLLALAPIAMALCTVSWALSTNVGLAVSPGVESYVAIAAGAFGVSALATGIAVLVPKHGMALTICYMLFFDLPMGMIPASVKNLSVTYHVRVIGGITKEVSGGPVIAAIGIAAISAVGIAVAFWRIRRLEA